MTGPSEPRTRAAILRRTWLVLAGLVVVIRLPVLAYDGLMRAGRVAPAVQRALTTPAAQRIERASGVSAALAAAIRASDLNDGRLVLYSPYGGAEFELDAGDVRGEPARQVRTMFERIKNLLYPRPRDVHFARDPEELRSKVAAGLDGRLVVLEGRIGALDGPAAPPPLAVGGDYALVHEEALGSAGRLRLWRLERAR